MFRLGLCLSLLIIPALAETPRVSQVASIALRPSESAFFDVDGDGDLDLVSGGWEPRAIWRENLGGREFGLPKTLHFFSVGSDPQLTDIDGDGIVDGLTTLWQEIGSKWAIGFGSSDGSYTPSVLIDGDLNAPQLVSLGPDLPVVIDRTLEGHVVIWKLLPSGGLEPFGGGASPLTFESNASSFVPVDIDADGDVDLVGENVLFRRSGSESFDAPVPFGERGDWTDLDGDGFPDRYRADSDVFQYEINLEGEGLSETQSIVLGSIGIDSTWSKFVGTTDTEVGRFLCWIIRRSEDRVFSLVDVDRETGLVVREQPLGALPESTGFSVADLDADGYRDVLAWNPRGENIAQGERIFWGGAGGFAAGPDLAEGFPSGELLLCEDFDGDGERDLLMGWISGRYCQLIRGRGDGTFLPGVVLVDLIPQTFAEAEVSVTSLMAADFDLDGKVDLLATYRRKVGLQERSTTVIWKNLGEGMFADPAPPLSSMVTHQEHEPIALADWDGDGDPDVFFQGHWRRNNAGVLEPLERIFLERAMGADLMGNPFFMEANYAFGDIDGDGKLDCLSQIHRVEKQPGWLDPGSTFMLVAYGDGQGGIDEVVELAITQLVPDLFGNPQRLPLPVIHDLNGNGRGELVYVDSTHTDSFGNPMFTPRVLINPRDGRQPPASWIRYGFPSGSGNFLLRIDFDGDGLDDVVTDNTYLSPSQPVPVTRGTYNFTSGMDLWGWSLRAMADFDNDGDADLVYGGIHGGTLHLVRNQIVDERSLLGEKFRRLGVLGPASNPDADADGDGRSNLVEFMEGTDPFVADAGSPGGFGSAIKQTQDGMAFLFRQRVDAATFGLSYVVEESSDLVTWRPAGPAATISSSNEWQHKSLQIEEGGARRFFRLKYEQRVNK